MRKSCRLLMLLSLAWLTSTAPLASHAAPDQSSSNLPARIETLLSTNRIDQALQIVERETKRSPSDGMIWLRAGQTHLCEYVALMSQVSRGIEPIQYAGWNRVGCDYLVQLSQEQRAQLGVDADKLERLIKRVKAGEFERYTAVPDERLKSIAALLTRSFALPKQIDAELLRAGQTGAPESELKVTRYWSLFLREIDRAQLLKVARMMRDAAALPHATPLSPQALSLVELLEGSRNLAGDAALKELEKEVIAFGSREEATSGDLAAAADLLTVLSTAIPGSPRPLSPTMMDLINKKSAAGGHQPATANGAQAREAYKLVVADQPLPANAGAELWAYRFYDQALKKAGKAVSSPLRLRVIALRMAFDPSSAKELIQQELHEHRDSAGAALEEARFDFQMKQDPAAGVAACVRAVSARNLVREALPGTPTALLRSLDAYPPVVERISEVVPDYQCLFAPLIDFQTAAATPEQRLQIRLVRLQLASLLCGGTAYRDRLFGIHQKTLVLRELRVIRDRLPAQIQMLLDRELAQHDQTYADFPVTRISLILTPDGVFDRKFPSLPSDQRSPDGPQLVIGPSGFLVFPDVKTGKGGP